MNRKMNSVQVKKRFVLPLFSSKSETKGSECRSWLVWRKAVFIATVVTVLELIVSVLLVLYMPERAPGS